MLIDYLKEYYGYCEPIFINSIIIDGMSDNALRQNFNRLLKNGSIERFDSGIYYLPKSEGVLQKSYLDSNKVILKKYIKDGQRVFGYLTGFSFANQIGITSQNPVVVEIASNVESSKGRDIIIGNKRIRVKRSKAIVTSENYKELQLLDLIGSYEVWSECDYNEVKERFIKYIREEKLQRNVVKQYLCKYSCLTARRLIEMELIYEFASPS